MSGVEKIIQDVRNNGDTAIKYYTKKFDSIDLDKFIVTKEEIKNAYKSVDKETIKALKFAKQNIKNFSLEQFKQYTDFNINKNGIIIGQKVVCITCAVNYL